MIKKQLCGYIYRDPSTVKYIYLSNRCNHTNRALKNSVSVIERSSSLLLLTIISGSTMMYRQAVWQKNTLLVVLKLPYPYGIDSVLSNFSEYRGGRGRENSIYDFFFSNGRIMCGFSIY